MEKCYRTVYMYMYIHYGGYKVKHIVQSYLWLKGLTNSFLLLDGGIWEALSILRVLIY